MKIKIYSIPKLPRSKYASVGSSYTSSGSGTSIVNNYNNNTKVIDNLLSDSTTSALSANQGNILNTTKLSKSNDDTANGKITFNKGLLVKDSILTDSQNQVGLIKAGNEWWLSANLINGVDRIQGYNGAIMNNFSVNKDALIKGSITLGNGFKTKDYADNIGSSLYQDTSNKWNLVVDNAKVRGRLDVETLQIEQARAVGGKIYCTKAALKISNIGEDNNIYRCYFKTLDNEGNTIYNQFQEGDLAFCQTFNNNKVKRYWRYVTGAGRDFVDLSKSRFEANSDVPEIGDEVVLLGSANDVSRLGAVVIEQLAINIYNGINSFSLPRPVITLNPFNSKIDAKSILFLGKTLINNNFIVDTQGNLTIKGTINADKGYFRGFIQKGITTITKYNIKNYIINEDLYGDGSLILNEWDFKNLSNIIHLNGEFPDSLWEGGLSPTLYFPSIYPDVNDYTEYSLNNARSFVGTELLLYNNSNTVFSLSGAMTNIENPRSFVSHPLLPNKCMKLRCVHRWLGGIESVFWIYEDGTFKIGK